MVTASHSHWRGWFGVGLVLSAWVSLGMSRGVFNEDLVVRKRHIRSKGDPLAQTKGSGRCASRFRR